MNLQILEKKLEKACKDAAKNVIPLKHKLKKRLHCEILYIYQKRDMFHQASTIVNQYLEISITLQMRKTHSLYSMISNIKKQADYSKCNIDEI